MHKYIHSNEIPCDDLGSEGDRLVQWWTSSDEPRNIDVSGWTAREAVAWLIDQCADDSERGSILAGTLEVVEVTDDQIEALRTESGAVGDLAMVAICDLALDGDTGARDECWRVLDDARAMAD